MPRMNLLTAKGNMDTSGKTSQAGIDSILMIGWDTETMNAKEYAALVKRCIKKGQVTAATPLQMPVKQRVTTKNLKSDEAQDYSIGSDNMKEIFKNLMNNG